MTRFYSGSSATPRRWPMEKKVVNELQPDARKEDTPQQWVPRQTLKTFEDGSKHQKARYPLILQKYLKHQYIKWWYLEIARGPYISGTELKSKSGRALNPERGVVQESDIQTARIDLTVIGTYRTPTRADVVKAKQCLRRQRYGHSIAGSADEDQVNKRRHKGLRRRQRRITQAVGLTA